MVLYVHLLCHDDVIGTRRVSYIIYMTDPDDPWVEEDGGSLELYRQTADAISRMVDARLSDWVGASPS